MAIMATTRQRSGGAGAGLLAELKELMLGPPSLSLAVAESLTCGRVQARIGEISGASDFFHGGITAYSLEQKVRHLGVARAAAKRVNSVSATVAEQMACGVCALFDSDLGIATTGYAEPSPENDVADPFAWWAIAHGRKGGRGVKSFITVRSGRVECPGAKRIEVQAIVADAALPELVAYLRERRG
jgi:nicotinamide-nucleotide amidase